MANFDPFESDFRQRANSIRRTPSPTAWNRLEHRLDRQGRTGGRRLFGIRPWMIAALFLVIAGTVGLSLLSDRNESPLAQRSESIEDLDAAFNPAENFDADAFRARLRDTQHGTSDGAHAPAEFRDVTVSAKYRS